MVVEVNMDGRPQATGNLTADRPERPVMGAPRCTEMGDQPLIAVVQVMASLVLGEVAPLDIGVDPVDG